MKRKFLSLIVCAFTVFTFSGCAVGLVGIIYTDVTTPAAATSNKVGTKVGESTATSVLNLVATGDAGINAAAKQGGITNISHVDFSEKSILGIFTKVTTRVYGN